jgi:BMFP domain-containing protein YqiC
MMKILASGWEKTFARRLPMVFAGFLRNAAAALRKFHRDIEARARKMGSSIAGLHMLHDQVTAYENILKDLATSVREYINTTQKDINREFTPTIERAMVRLFEITHIIKVGLRDLFRESGISSFVSSSGTILG